MRRGLTPLVPLVPLVQIAPTDVWDMVKAEADAGLAPPLLVGGFPRTAYPGLWPHPSDAAAAAARARAGWLAKSSGGDIAVAPGRALPPSEGFFGWYGATSTEGGGYRHKPPASADEGWVEAHALHPSWRVPYPLEYVVLLEPRDFRDTDFRYWCTVATRCVFIVSDSLCGAAECNPLSSNPVHLLRLLSGAM